MSPFGNLSINPCDQLPSGGKTSSKYGPWAPFGRHLGPFGPPLGLLWPSWGTLGLWNLASSQVPRIAARSAFLELATGAAGTTGAGEVVAGSAARTPHPTRAGGQDDGSYTNSLK